MTMLSQKLAQCYKTRRVATEVVFHLYSALLLSVSGLPPSDSFLGAVTTHVL